MTKQKYFSDYSELTALESRCVEIAQEAGKRLMTFFGKDELKISLKPNGSPVCQADIISHHFITEALGSILPDIPVISEESSVNRSSEKNSFWLVDPLDGTRDYIQGEKTFTINIALIHDNAPILGVVCAPALNTCYSATRGGKAWKRTESSIEEIHTRNPGMENIVLCSRDHGNSAAQTWAKNTFESFSLETMGSSLKFCKIAEGSAHFYPRFAPTRQWDTAAADIILSTAGGAIIPLNGERFFYDGKSSANPDFIACWNQNGIPITATSLTGKS